MMFNKELSIKKKINNACNLKSKKTTKKLLSLYTDLIVHKKRKVNNKKIICQELVQKELLNYHSSIEGRLFLISQILKGYIPMTNKRIKYPLTLEWDPVSQVNMLSSDNSPIDIINYFEKSPYHDCIFLDKSLGKMSYPFLLNFKKNTTQLSLKIGYFIKNSIKKYPQNQAYIVNKERIKSQIRMKHNLSSDNPGINQLFSRYIISDNMSQIEKKVKYNLLNKDSLKSKIYTKNSLLNHYVEIEPNLPVNVENKIIYLLSEFVFKKNTPHINLPIFSFRTSLSKLNLNLDLYPKIKEDIQQDRILNNVSILVSEWCSHEDLKIYLSKNFELFKKNPIYWNILFFQIIYTLTVIQMKYPNFRHNDLHLKNILVQETNTHKSDNYLYHLKIKHKDYYFVIPDIGIQIRIWDYDWSSIDKLVTNKKAVQKNRHIPNRTFDLFCCMFLLEKVYKGIMVDNLRDEHLSFFADIKEGISEGDLGTEKKHLLRTNQEFAIPESILLRHSNIKCKNGIFKMFRYSAQKVKHMNYNDQYSYSE